MPTLNYQPGIIEKILKELNVTTYNTLKTQVGAAGNFAVGAGRQEAHVIRGHNKKNIQQQVVSDHEVKVVAKAIYAGWENKRGGDHAFFDILYERTKEQFKGSVVMGKIQETFRNKAIR